MDYRYGVYVCVALWLIGYGSLSLYYGFLNSLINPFIWVIVIIETLEYVIFIFSGGSPLKLFEVLGSGFGEGWMVLSGIITIPGWLIGLISVTRDSRTREMNRWWLYSVAVFIYNPITNIVALVYYLGQTDQEG